jgi:uncharacterized protein YdaU (DUF1376 family)
VPGKPPYFPFYVNDFAADGVVECMTTEQVGAYALLLCKAWYQEPAGTIPDDDATLCRWSRLTPERWSQVKAGVVAAFKPGEDGRLHQKRMEVEYAKLTRLLKAKSAGGKKGAKNRWSEPTQTPNGIPTQKPTCRPKRKPDGSVDGIENTRAFDSDSNSDSPPGGVGGAGGRGRRRPGPEGDGFAEFWMAYPRKTAKADARRAWAKIGPTPELRAVMLAALERQKHSADWRKEGGKYVPHPATWLNGERWEDEAPAGPNAPGPGSPPDDDFDPKAHGVSPDRARELLAGPDAPAAEGGGP